MRILLHRLVVALLLVAPVLSHAQEICNNGIDDDGDGLIDLNDTTDCICNAIIGGGIPSIIPNPSFEDMNCCPSGFAQLNCAQTWIQATWATSDYINQCDWTPPAVPLPIPDGQGCVSGLALVGWQEYVGACLLQPMTSGTSYSLSMMVAAQNADDALQAVNPAPFSAIDLTIYGTANCAALPVGTNGCPTDDPNWFVLGSVNYQPNNVWSNVTITFTPGVDVSAIIIGSPCVLPPDYPALGANFNSEPWFFFDDLTLNESSLFGATITHTGTWCNNNLTLHGNPDELASNFQWYQEGVALVGQTDSLLLLSALGLDTGNYQFVASVDTSCVTSTLHVGPPAYPEPLLSAAPVAGCAPLQVVFNDDTDPDLVGTVEWHFGDGDSSSVNDPTHTYTDGGVYDVSLAVTSPDGCVSDTTYADLIEVYSLPVAQFTADTLEGCIGLTVQFTNTTDTLTGTCAWTFGDGAVSNICDPSHTYFTSGLFNVQLTVTSPNQCVDDTLMTQLINVHPNPDLSFTTDTVAGCTPLAIEFTNTTPFWQIDSVHWDFGNGVTSNDVNASATYVLPGLYTVSVSVTDNVGCSSDTTEVNLIRAYGHPEVSFTNFPDSGCYALAVTFLNTTDPNMTANCAWTFGDGGTSTDCNPVYTYQDPGVYSVGLQVTSAQNCEGDTTYADLIHVFDHPTADFYFSPQPTDYFQTEIAFQDSSSSDVYLWQWSFGENGSLGLSAEVNPTLVFPDNDQGMYPVQLVVTNEHGCNDTIVKYVAIDGYFSVYVPNCFTPDGDGVNDGWRPIIMDQDSHAYSLRVFDRWGEEIWASTDPYKNWDGRAGAAAPKSDVYVWKLETRDAVNNVNKSFIGHVTVLP